MNKFKLTLSYDGTRYGGWQFQPNATSIQALVENALETALRQPTKLTGSGRTDSGVHALKQVAHFTHQTPVDCARLLNSLNGLLPKDIRVLHIKPAPETFHARFSASGKIYHYYLDSSCVPLPFKRLYSLHLPYHIDLELLRHAATFFVGEKDFTSFSNEAHRGSAARNPIRTIRRLDIMQQGSEITLEFEGNGFLYKMVRNCVGTLLDICRGKLCVEELPEIFAAKDRSRAGQAAPAHGLFLVKVLYD